MSLSSRDLGHGYPGHPRRCGTAAKADAEVKAGKSRQISASGEGEQVERDQLSE